LLDTKKLKVLVVKDSGFIFDPETGCIFTSNNNGLKIIDGLINQKSKEEIKQSLKNGYEIEEEKLERDLFDFFNQLISYGWIKEL